MGHEDVGSISVSSAEAAPRATEAQSVSSGPGGAAGPTGKALVGATVTLAAGVYSGCPGGGLDPCAYGKFDTFTSTASAGQLQKSYLTAGSLPATPAASWQNFVNQGGQLLISIKPSQTFSTATDTAFSKCVQGQLSAFGAGNFKLVLWQEANDNSYFPSASAYHTYHNHYGALVRAVSGLIPIVFDPGGYHMDTANTYYPGDQYVDEVAVDYYGSSWSANSRLDNADKTGYDFQFLADNHRDTSGNLAPIPMGLGEWGSAAGSSPCLTAAQWTNYTNYLTTFFTNRLKAGKQNGWIVGYMSSGPPGDTLGCNGISGAGDSKVPGYQKVYGLNPGTPPSVSTSSLPGAAIGTAYSASLTGTGGTAPRTWASFSGNGFGNGYPPLGLSINAGTGVITGTPKTPWWFASTGNITQIFNDNASLARQFFDRADSFAFQASPTGFVHPSGLACTPILYYKSYAQFSADITSNAITAPYQWVAYDPENWTATPTAEQNDPWTYLANFVSLAHANGYKTFLAPARDLANVTTSKHPLLSGESADEWYVRTGIADAGASAGTEIMHLQDQRNQDNLTEFRAFYQEVKAQALAANASVQVSAALTTEVSGTNMSAAAKLVPDAAGFWLNIPDSNFALAETCLSDLATFQAASHTWRFTARVNDATSDFGTKTLPITVSP